MKPAHPQSRLFKAVIVQAFKDARGPVDPAPKDAERRNDWLKWLNTKCKARAWLLGNSADFRSVCFYAECNPGQILRGARRLARRGWPDSKRTKIAA